VAKGEVLGVESFRLYEEPQPPKFQLEEPIRSISPSVPLKSEFDEVGEHQYRFKFQKKNKST
jgi:hypothetical protein